MSIHVGVAHIIIALQKPLVQSPSFMQFCAFAQLLGHRPPQSVSVSVPLVKPSLQLGVAHNFVMGLQKLFTQSPLTLQIFPSAQSATQLPPQSTSVSVPFACESLHAGAAQIIEVQTLLVQSGPIVHFLPSMQGPHVPPQSTSVSEPF
jgi:hypothetical protein